MIHSYKTISPIPLAEAASWDMEAIDRSIRIAARENVGGLLRKFTLE